MLPALAWAGVSPFSPSIIRPMGHPAATELMMFRRELRRICMADWNLPNAEPLLGFIEPPVMKLVEFSKFTPLCSFGPMTVMLLKVAVV